MNINKKTPFNKPFIVGKELLYIEKTVLSGKLSGDGEFTQKCHHWLEETLHCRKALLTHSCTAALEMSAILCGIEPGDEVIMPSFTFSSTATAFVLRGAHPIFVDIRKDTLNINEQLLESALTEKTKAIVPVHYSGIGCEMDTIIHFATNHNLIVVEDAAQGFLSTYKNKYLGSMGHLGCLSFHETKNIISGEGGALLINDEHFIERAEILREKGTDRSKFFRGEVDKYTWVDIGSSFLPSELIGAFLYAQLEESHHINANRKKTFAMYQTGLAPLENEGLLRLPHIPSHCTTNGHIFYVITHSPSERDAMLAFLQQRGIHAVFHYVPLHSSPAGRKFGRTAGNLDVTNAISTCLLRLPIYYDIEQEIVLHIVDCIWDFFGRKPSHCMR